MLKENKLQSKMNDTNFFVTLTFKHTHGFCLKEIQEKKNYKWLRILMVREDFFIAPKDYTYNHMRFMSVKTSQRFFYKLEYDGQTDNRNYASTLVLH